MIGGALALSGKGAQLVWRTVQKVVRLVDDLAGEPPGPGLPDGRPGLLQRLAAIEGAVTSIPALLARVTALEARAAALEDRTAAVEAQLLPNGGQSLRDSVDRVAAAVAPVDPPADTAP